jgi:type III secretory pathway component EscV
VSSSDDPASRPAEDESPKKSSGTKRGFGLIYAISHGLVRNQESRRKAMNWSIMVSAVMVFVGATFLSGYLQSRPAVFIGFWLACAWFMLLAVLLAVFDILVLQAKSRASRKAMHNTMLREEIERLKRQSKQPAEEEK